MILSFLFLSGCSKPQCKSVSDCDDGLACTEERCTSEGNCAYRNIRGCTCGDDLCDAKIDENECTCPDDCGICAGSQGDYLEKYCEEVEGKETCLLGLPPNKVTDKTLTDIIDTRKFKLAATYSYDDPFDVSRSVFHFDISLDSITDGVSEPKITEIQIFEKLDRKGQEINIFGEKEVNKILWSADTEISEDVILSKLRGNLSGSEKTTTIRINYEYKTSSRGNENDIVNKGSYEKEIGTAILFLNSGSNPSCPSSCDDQNVCTQDYCDEGTGYFCAHRMLSRACCGNNICDAQENTCVCPEDCGACSKIVGKFMEYTCQSNTCVTALRDPDVVQQKTLLDDRDWGNFHVQIKTTYNEPFSLNNDNFQFSFELVNMKEGTTNIRIKRFQMLDANELLGEKNVNIPLTNIGTIVEENLNMNFAKNIEDEEEKTLTLKIFYDYTPPPLRGEPQDPRINEVYTIGYGKVVFINPEI